MRGKVLISTGLSIIVVFALAALISCDNNPILGNEAEDLDPAMSQSQGIPASEMTWVSWNSEVKQKMKSLDKKGTQSKEIDDDGGKIGGKKTFGNKVKIPENALDEDYLEANFGDDEIRITVKVNCIDGKSQCGAGVDFLPSMKFQKDVKVTLSWEFLDWEEGEELDFLAYFSEDDGETWYEVDVAEINYKKKTLTVYVDHFTRFAWAL